MAGLPNMPSPPSGTSAAGSANDSFSERLAAMQDAARRRANGEPEAEAQPQADEQTADSGGPVGQGDYEVKQGECISSIAKETGHFWETIWTDPGNAQLKEVRKDPNVLLPGDRVTIPEKLVKQEPGDTEMRHRFVRRGEPSILRLRFLDLNNAPRANEAYSLKIDDEEYDGVTDSDGVLEVFVAADARTARIEIANAVHEFRLRHLDPRDAQSGARARLRNLGFYSGPDEGGSEEVLRQAIERFQQSQGISVSGELDAQTCEALREQHRS